MSAQGNYGMELQHVNVKLLLRDPEQVDMDLLVPIFHSWIREQVCEERLVDVTDYSHVTAGPGVILVGLEADYSLDNTDNRLGLRYNRKAVFDGDNQSRLVQAAAAAIKACQRLETDAGLEGKLSFNGQDLEISVNDRLLVSNSEEARESLRPELQNFSEKLFGGKEFALSYNTDSRRLFTAYLRAAEPISTDNLLSNVMSE